MNESDRTSPAAVDAKVNARSFLRPALLLPGGLALLVAGVALVFGAVVVRGLFIPGVILIDAGMLALLAAAVLFVALPRTDA
jgi:hypothetical protein